MKKLLKMLMPLVAIVALALPWSARAQVTVTIGDGGTATSSYLPTYTLYNNTLSEQIYTADEIGMPGTITSIAFYNGGSTKTVSAKIYMINTTVSAFTSTTAWLPVTASDQVFDGTVTFTAGQWTTITLDNPFTYDGASNLGLIFDGNLDWSSGLACRVFDGTSNCAMYVYSDPTDYNAVGATYTASARLSVKNQLQLDIMPADMDCYPIRQLTASNIGPWACTLSWMDTNNSGATYTVISLPDSTELASGIVDTTIDLTGLDPETSYTFGVYADCGGDGTSMILNVHVTTLPSCPQPTQLVIDSLTPEDLYFHWTPGFEETEWYITINDSVVGSVSDTAYGITNLTPNTLYTVALRAICGADDTSSASILSFRTACSYISTVPVTEDFESYGTGTTAFPTCWYKLGSTADRPYVNSSTTYGHNNTYGLYFYAASSGYCYGIMPPVDPELDLTTLQVRFWARQYSTSYNCSFAVGVMTDPTDPASFVGIDTVHPAGTTYEDFEVPFANYTGTGNYIAFKAIMNSGSGIYMMLDDVTLEEIPACPRPSSIAVDGVSQDSLYLHLNDPINTDWLVVYGPAGFNPDTAVVNVMDISDPVFSIGDLTPNTQYDIYVMALCTNGDTTDARLLSVRTACGTTSLPFADDFNSYASSSYPDCWGRVMSGSYPYITTSYGTCIQFAGTATVIAPPIDAPLNQMIVSFDLRKEGASSGQMTFGYSTDPIAASNMVVLQTIDPSSTGTYFHYEYDFSTDTSLANLDPDSVYYIVWRQSSTATNWYYWLDNVYIEQFNPCAKPQNFICTSTQPDSVVVMWNAGDATSWELYVGPAGVPVNADSAITVTDTVYNFTDLLGGVGYDFYVRTDCGGEYSNWAGPLNIVPGQYIMGSSSTSINMCGGIVYDDGGPDGAYSASANYSLTIYPTHPDSMLTFQGTAYLESNSWDHLRIYEGVGTSGTLLWENGNSTAQVTIPYTVVYSGSPITITFSSDGSGQYDGWGIQIGCMSAPECSSVENLQVFPTPTAALVTWQPGYYGTYSGATIEYKVDTADSWTSLPAITGTVTHAVISGLDPLTDYNVRVTTDCDGFSGGVATIDFTTSGFGCLVSDPTTSHQDTIVGTTLTTSYHRPTNNFYRNTFSEQVYLASELNGAGNIVNFSFDYGYSTPMMDKTNCQVYMANTTLSSVSSSNYVTPANMTLVYSGSLNCSQGWNEFALNTPFAYTGGNLAVAVIDNSNEYDGSAYVWNGHNASGMSFSWYSDSYTYPNSSMSLNSDGFRPNMAFSMISCLQENTCAAPAVAVIEVTSSTASLAWAPGNSETSWNLYYRLAGDATWSAPIAVTGSSYTITGLNQGRRYEFKLENACTEGTFSSMTQATLLCAQISSLPFFENFNGWGTGVTPNCWSNAAGYTPTSYGIISSSYNHSGTTGGSIYMYSSSGTYITYLALPELDTNVYPVNQTQLVLNLFYTSSSYSAPQVAVGVMTDQNNAASFVPVDTVVHSGALNTWEIFEVPLTNYTGNGSYVAVRTAYPGTYSYFYMDDVTLEQIPTCPRPDSLTASNATTNSIDLAWHDRAGASQWIIEYGPRGFQLGTGTTVTVTSNPYTLTGLPASYQGEYYVRAVCSTTDTGEYSRQGCAFGTTQIPATLPYNYNFEDVTEWNNWQTSTNHETNNWYRGTSVADSGSYSMYVATGATASYYDYSFNAVVNAAVYRDIDFGPVDSSYTISFRARAGGTLESRYDGLMVFLVDPSLPTAPSTSNITSPWGNVNDLYRIATIYLDTTWQTYEASFDTISGIHRVAFFWFNQNTSDASIPQPAAVDNIHINYSTCPRPVNVEINPGSTIAHVSWQGAPDATYQVIYRQYPGSYANTFVTTSTNHITLSGLISNTQYAVWVRKICGVGDTSLTSDGELFMTTMCDGGTEALNYNPSTSSTTSLYSPIGYSLYNYSYVQTIIDSADLVSLAGDISAFAFNVGTFVSNASTMYNNMTVYMANVSETNLSSGFIHPDANHVFKKVIDSASFNYTEEGWQIHNLDSTFTWDGHSNLLVSVKRDNGTYSGSQTFIAHTASASKMRYVYQDSGPYDPNTVSSGTASTTVGDIRLISCGATVSCTDPVINLSATEIGENDITLHYLGEANQYELGIVEGNNWIEPAATYTTNDTFYTFNGLTAATQYTLGVRSVCTATIVSAWSYVTLTTAEHPCFVPTGVTVTSATYDGGTIIWTAGENETSWEVSIVSTAAGYEDVILVNDTPTLTVEGLSAGTAYSITVRSVCGTNHYSDWTEPVVLNTLECDQVTGVAASEITANSVKISWTATGATKYVVEYGNAGYSAGAGNQTVVENANQVVINGLDEQSFYDVYVSQFCTETLQSPWSAKVNFQTEAGIGIDEVENGNVALYPNPASTTVTVSGIEGEAMVTVVDMNGREVYTATASGSVTIDVNGYAKGAYFVRVTGERTTAIRKLIVK